jgi:hypothetical protein
MRFPVVAAKRRFKALPGTWNSQPVHKPGGREIGGTLAFLESTVKVVPRGRHDYSLR